MRLDLVVVPFVEIHHPALGVSSLKALARGAGHESTVHYEAVRFAERMGPLMYHWFALVPANYRLMLGDFLFALLRRPAAEREARIQRFVTEAVTHYIHQSPVVAERFAALIRGLLPGLEAESELAAARLLAGNPDVLGFSVAPLQVGAALHLAALVKARRPGLRVWFGGQSCQGVLGWAHLKSFPYVDAVFSGEGEPALARALERLDRSEPLTGIPGVLTREGLETGATRVPPDEQGELVRDLDTLPHPDFDDYFAALRDSRVLTTLEPYVILESSRGCWWGARSPCHFCGLNAQTQVYRAKSADRVQAELDAVVGRHGVRHVEFADNVMTPAYYSTLLPRLEGRDGPELFFELRAGASHEQVRQLRRAGVTVVQVGVEALDDRFLELMNKGSRAHQNLELIKWCEEEGILLHYNLLFAIPGEDAGCYRRTHDLIAQLHHLRPPNPVLLRLDRFSTFESDPARFDIRPGIPSPISLPHCFPEEGADIRGLAYHFEMEFGAPGTSNAAWWTELASAMRRWRLDYHGAHKRLLGRRVDSEILIEDNRFSGEVESYALSRAQGVVLEACDALASREALAAAGAGAGLGAAEVEAALAFLLERRLVVALPGGYLGIVVFTSAWPTRLDYRKRPSFIQNLRIDPAEVPDPTARWLLLNTQFLFSVRLHQRLATGQ